MDKKKRKEMKMALTRRHFIKGSAAVAGGLMMGNLTGCSSDGSDSGTNIPGTLPDTSYEIKKLEGYIFIGGGIGSLTGIRELLEQGKKVTVIDKGPWRAGGASGYNWDVNTSGNWDADGTIPGSGPVRMAFGEPLIKIDPATLQSTAYHGNQVLAYEARIAEKYMHVRGYVDKGEEVFPRRLSTEEANLWNTENRPRDIYTPPYNNYLAPVPITFTSKEGNLKWDIFNMFPGNNNAFTTNTGVGNGMIDGGFPRHWQDAHTDSVTVIDRTMVTNIVVNNGRCVGVVGVYLPTGKYTVYTADAVILTAGGNTWWAGWESVSSHGANSPDNTSDVEMALFRRGCGIGDAEYAQYDYTTSVVKGFIGGYNLIIGGDCTHAETIVDKNGDNYWKDYGFWPAMQQSGQRIGGTQDLQVATAKFIHAEKTKPGGPTRLSPNGGVYLLTDPNDKRTLAIRNIYRRNFWLYEQAGFNPVTQGKIEAQIEMWEHAGTPIIDTDMMTEIKGLFNQRGSGAMGQMGGIVEGYNKLFSQHAARKAVAYVSSAGAVGTVDYSEAENELQRLEEIRTRSVTGGLRPHVVRQRIQHACGPVCGPLRYKDELVTAKAELARIRAEDLPKQTCADKSRMYNIEWKQAVENYNLLDMAELFVNASLAREESRYFYRPDFPNQDDTNFNCSLIGRLENNNLTFAKRHLPALNWLPSVMSGFMAPPDYVDPETGYF